MAEKGKADMSEAARKAWATRRQKYGEKGLNQKAEPIVEQQKKAKKSSQKEQSKKTEETSKPEQPAETETDN